MASAYYEWCPELNGVSFISGKHWEGIKKGELIQQQISEAENTPGLDNTVWRVEAYMTRPRLIDVGRNPPKL